MQPPSTAALGRLEHLPRVTLLGAPTLLEPMENLSRAHGGAALWVKRDDAMGLAFGGNKVRQLEFYLGAARAEGADTVLITGAVQSNFARLAAAGARRLGMQIHIQQEERVAKDDPRYRRSGNVLLEHLLGATIHSYPEGEDEAGADANLHRIADELRGGGRRPYIIPLAPGHPPLGALGYVRAAGELLEQMAGNPAPDEIVVASGSGNTHAGLLFGLRARGCGIPVLGVCVRRQAEPQRPRISTRCAQIADLLEIPNPVTEDDVMVDDSFLPPGYGHAGTATLEAILLAARTEALILDPTYTGKTMAGALARATHWGPGRTVLFIHTGGTPAVFAYEQDLMAAVEDAH